MKERRQRAGAWTLAEPSTRHSPTERQITGTNNEAMKILLWIVAIIFLIGLAVVFGLGSLIF